MAKEVKRPKFMPKDFPKHHNPITFQAKKELQQFLRQSYLKKEGSARVLPQNRNMGSASRKEGYIYIYDTFLQDNQYRGILKNIERRLNDFEIGGKIVKMTSFTNPRTLIEDEMRHGAKTIVMVGNDETLVRVLLRAADLDVVFGFLPIGLRKNHFAKVLGLPLNEKTCDILAARKIEKLDYGSINQKNFFLCYLYIPEARLKIECDENFVVGSGKERLEIAIANLLPPPFESERFTLHPQDGKMELYLRPSQKGLIARFLNKKGKKPSVFFFRKLVLKSDKPMTIVADDRELHESYLTVEVNKKKLAMIVGKGRQF